MLLSLVRMEFPLHLGPRLAFAYCLMFFFLLSSSSQLHIESPKQSVCQVTIYTNTMQNLGLRRDPSLLSQVGMQLHDDVKHWTIYPVLEQLGSKLAWLPLLSPKSTSLSFCCCVRGREERAQYNRLEIGCHLLHAHSALQFTRYFSSYYLILVS